MKKGLRLADGVLLTWVLFYFSLSSVRSIISCAPSRSPAKGNPCMLGVYRPAKTLGYSPGGVGRQIFVQCMVCLILGEEQAPRLPNIRILSAVLITWTIALQLNDRTARFCIFPVWEAALVQSSRCWKMEKLELPSFSGIIPTFSCDKKKITWFDIVSNQVTNLGWIMGLEPTIFRATIWRLSQLGHIHHIWS